MSKKDKGAREAAVRAEQERRWREKEASSPISRSDLQALVDFVAARVEAGGHDRTFARTEAWLGERGMAPGPILEFLRAQRVQDDYDLLIRGDPWSLFGPTPERLAWMPIERADLEALIAEVDARCGEAGCDHSVRFTREFLARRALPVATTVMALLAKGGGCDCEVVLNVEPESIYPAPGGPRMAARSP